METVTLFLVAFLMYWVLIREKPVYLDGPSVGFWTSCLENFRTQGPADKLQPELNAAAAQYVARVYGYRVAGKIQRRCLAFFVMGWVVQHTLLSNFSLLRLPCSSCAVVLWGIVLWKLKQSGVPLNKKMLALEEISKIRQGPHGSAIDAALSEVHPPSIWWWPWSGCFLFPLWFGGEIGRVALNHPGKLSRCIY